MTGSRFLPAAFRPTTIIISSFMRRSLHLLVGCVMLLSCSQSDADAIDGSSVMAFDTTLVYLTTGRDTFTILAEVARSAEQKAMGLMERRFLSDTAGMLFLYTNDQPANAGYWMCRTRNPLEIAYADSAGRIVSLRQMVPCDAQLAAGCPTYDPGQAYRMALEVNAGGLSRRGIGVGSRLWASALPASRRAR
jgi:uncharacterized membrane protein (UPF0127 family)